MIYNLGSTVPLVWSTPSDLGQATAKVTAPDGTVITSPPVTFSAGSYTYSYATTQAGLHTVVWSALSVNPTVFEDVFDIRPQAPTSIVSLDDVREHLRLASIDTRDNTKLQSITEACSNLIMDITGPMNAQTFTESFDGGKTKIFPSHTPLISVVTLKEYYGLAGYTLTEQPLGSQTSGFGFTVDYSTGEVSRRTFSGSEAYFAPGSKNVIMTYTAGRKVVPENVQLATKELVRHFYIHTQVPGRPQYGSASDEGYGEVPIGFAVPNFVVEMLQPHRRAPGIA